MAQRTVTDGSGRTWTCTEVEAPVGATAASDGRPASREGVDVTLSCTTESVPEPVVITVGWGWERIADKGLARMISQAAPGARR
jgi:hypothetical protein